MKDRKNMSDSSNNERGPFSYSSEEMNEMYLKSQRQENTEIPNSITPESNAKLPIQSARQLPEADLSNSDQRSAELRDKYIQKQNECIEFMESVVPKEEFADILKDSTNGSSRIVALMDKILENGSLDKYLKLAANAHGDAQFLYDQTKSTPETVEWKELADSYEAILSRIPSVWNSATRVTTSRFVELSNYGDTTAFLEAKQQLQKLIAEGEKIEKVSKQLISSPMILTNFDDGALQKAKYWMEERKDRK